MIYRSLIYFISLFAFNIAISYSKDIGMIVVEENLNVYDQPSTSSKIIASLKAGYFVVYRSKLLDTNLNRNIFNNWIYIDTGIYKNSDTEKIIFGWVRKSGVAEPKDFKKVTLFESFKVVGSMGDSYYNYTFCKDGTYIRYNEKMEKIKGRVYKKGVVFLAKDSEYFQVFTIDNEGYYNFSCEDEDGKPVRIKSKIYRSKK